MQAVKRTGAKAIQSKISNLRLKIWNELKSPSTKSSDLVAVEFRGRTHQIPGHWSAVDFLKDRNHQSLLNEALLAQWNHKPTCLHAPLNATISESSEIKLQVKTTRDLHDFDAQKDLFGVFWHSSAHLMAAAVQEQYGTDRILLCNGPSTERGFYYDMMMLPESLQTTEAKNRDAQSPFEQLARLIEASGDSTTGEFISTDIETCMKSIAKEKHHFERREIPVGVALEMFADNPFKCHYIRQATANNENTVTVYKCGDLIDLCRGPHVYSTEMLAAAIEINPKSTLVHWSPALKFVETNPSSPLSPFLQKQYLTRVSGITFPSQKLMNVFVQQRQEAAERDHRHIGTQQHLFMMHPQTPGTLFLLPHGMRIVKRLKELLRSQYSHLGYEEVSTPLIYDKGIWEQSGHWANYREDMYVVKGGITKAMQAHTEAEDESQSVLGLKPMNCPAHCLIYESQARSFRDLPLRIADFSPLHRNEMSGTLTGLTRLRQFHQDDAHIFCTPEQTLGEIRTTLNLFHRLYVDIFKFPSYELVLSTRPNTGTIGSSNEWDAAERTLNQALTAHYEAKFPGQSFKTDAGAGAFYGPKIDLLLKDSQKRTHQLATVQLDFQLPIRFNLHYQRSGVEDRGRPVMIHRAALGSLERFWAVWMEETRGKWPFWASPRQIKLVPVFNTKKYPSQPILDYTNRVARYLSQRYPHRDSLQTFNDQQPVGGDLWWTGRFYVDVDMSDNTLNKKILEAQHQRYNFTVVIGQRELEQGQVSVRRRDSNTSETLSVEAFHHQLLDMEAKFQ